jgi:hypothetical protein
MDGVITQTLDDIFLKTCSKLSRRRLTSVDATASTGTRTRGTSHGTSFFRCFHDSMSAIKVCAASSFSCSMSICLDGGQSLQILEDCPSYLGNLGSQCHLEPCFETALNARPASSCFKASCKMHKSLRRRSTLVRNRRCRMAWKFQHTPWRFFDRSRAPRS